MPVGPTKVKPFKSVLVTEGTPEIEIRDSVYNIYLVLELCGFFNYSKTGQIGSVLAIILLFCYWKTRFEKVCFLNVLWDLNVWYLDPLCFLQTINSSCLAFKEIVTTSITLDKKYSGYLPSS